jgi:hypothetical protein
MTDLQISLTAIGGAILVGLVSYNKWQEYRTRKSVERAFGTSHEDVLMQPGASAPEADGRQEPHFDADLAAADAAESSTFGEPAIGDDAAAAEQFIETAAPLDLSVDPLVDCVIPLELTAPVRGDKVLALIQNLRHVGNKPVHFIGHNEQGGWEEIARGAVYNALQAGVQMANRQNALNEIEYSELVQGLRGIADELDADLDVPDMMGVMQAARELHQFVTECYAQLSVNVMSRGAPWDVATLLGALKRQGFDLRPDGRLVMPDGDSGILFTLSTNAKQGTETTSLLTLLLEVPCVPPSRDGFGTIVSCARMLAGRLDGVMVDDGNQPLSDDAVGEIADQVKDFYEHMDASEVPAGSNRALRLFA